VSDIQSPTPHNVVHAHPLKDRSDDKLVHMKRQFDVRSFARRYWPIITAFVISIFWLSSGTYYFITYNGATSLASMPLQDIAVYMSAGCIPLIAIWLAALVFLRTDPLREHRLALSHGLDGVLSPIDIAQKRLDNMLQSLHKELHNVEATSDLAVTRISELEGRFSGQITILFESLTKAEKQAQQLQNNLATQTQDTRLLSEQLEQRSIKIGDKLQNLVSLIQDAADQSDQKAQDITQQLSQQTQDLNNNSQQITHTLSRLGEELNQLTADMQTAATQTNKHFHENITSLETQQQSISDAMAELRNDTETVCQKIGLHAQDIATLSHKTREEGTLIEDTLRKNTETLSQAAMNAMTQAKESGELFGMQARRISRSFNSSIEQSRHELDDFITLQEQKLDQLQQSTLDRLSDLQTTCNTVCEDLSRRNEDFTQSLIVRQDVAREQLNHLSQDIENKLTQQNNVFEQTLRRHEQKSITSLNALQLDTEQNLSQQLNLLQDHFSHHVKALENRARVATSSVRQQADELAEKLEEVNQLNAQNTDLDQKAERLLSDGQARMAQYQQTINNMESETAKAAEAFDNLKQFSQESMQDLRSLTEGINKAAKQSQEIKETIEESGERETDFLQQKQSIKEASQDAQKSIEALYQELSQAAENIYLASASATEATDETLRAISYQENGLNQLINALQKEAVQLQSVLPTPATTMGAEQHKQDHKAHEEERAFSELSTQILEKLNALSIDIARSIEDDLPDMAWDDFLKGDKTIFTRRLRRLTGRKNKTLITTRYHQDPDFKRDVDDYIRLFEDMMRQAMHIAPNGPLTLSLISSDTGKAYIVLAQALEKIN